MYTEHFHLREEPFSITPDPAFVYMSPRHREALGHLLYGTGRHGGFVQLTGEVGTGKTTIVRTLLAQDLDGVDAAVILNPRQSEHEFLASICDELHIPYPAGASQKTLVDTLNAHLLDAHRNGRRTVLIIDEAQNLNRDVLETVRLLTNLETHKDKLLRIMLVGQPELAELLARDDLRQVAQRITARFHLTALQPRETREYIAHRLRTAGGDPRLFDDAAMRRVHQLSGGTPRLINIICDRALLGAYAAGETAVSREMVDRAAVEALGEQGLKLPRRLPEWALPAALTATILLGAVLLWPGSKPVPLTATERAQGTAAAAVAVEDPASPAPPAAPEPQPHAGPGPAPAAGQPAGSAPLQGLAGRLTELAALWSVPPPAPSSDYCQAIAAHGLRCYRARGDWSLLRSLNRPAILTLGSGADERHVLLTGLDGDIATLIDADGRPARRSLSALDSAWNGDFLMLWKPEVRQALIGPDSRGEPVRWLRAKLDRIAGRPLGEAGSDRYDEALMRQVAAFQRSRALDIDGLVGTQTMIALNDADPDSGGPRLRQRGEH